MQLDAYIRVSDVGGRSGESFISPSDQRDRIENWAKSQGHKIAQFHEELDVSGGSTDRPLLNEVMRRIEAGQTGGVVVAKIDRFGRTLVGTLELIKRIQAAGGLFASVADQFDITTATGRFVLNMMLSMAQFELERITDSWDTAKRRAIGRGVHLGNLPYGYRRNGGKKLEPDPVTGPIVTELFDRRAAGESLTKIRDWLATDDPTNRAWSTTKVLKALKTPTYLGQVHHGDYSFDGAHPPLTDHATWQRCQVRATGPRKRHPDMGNALLRGIVRCASCRYAMIVMYSKNSQRRNGITVYRCNRHTTRGDCPTQNEIIATDGKRYVDLDAYVLDQLWKRAPEIEAHSVVASSEIEKLEFAFKVAKGELTAYAADREIEDAAGREAFLAGLSSRREAVEAAQSTLDEALRRVGGKGQSIRTLREDWPGMSLDDRCQAIAQAIQVVFIRPRVKLEGPALHTISGFAERDKEREKRLRAARLQGASATRVHIVWADDPPVDVPRQGRRGYVLHPFTFPNNSN